MKTIRDMFGGVRSEPLALVIIKNIKEGDLTDKIQNHKKMDTMLSAIEEMAKTLDANIYAIGTSTNSISLVIDNISSNAWQMSEGAKLQAGQAAQIATAAEEMSQTITDIAKSAADASEMSLQALDTATRGKAVAEESINMVSNVNSSVAELSSHISVLNTRVHEIGNIVEIINDIADQTNLLALNAAIEAARAGESGRGFAVVADEVRKLAEKTIKATADISGKIKAVQVESSKTTESMQSASANIQKSSEHIHEMSTSLNSITTSVSSAKDRVVQIATAVEEQSTASEEIARNVENTASITKQTQELAMQVMNDASNLMKVEEGLRQSVLKFRTRAMEKTMIDIGKIDHRRFVKRILSAINGDIKIEASSLPDHHHCRFGKWYDKEGTERYGGSTNFRAIVPPHEKIHAMAKDIIHHCGAGNNDQAKALYQEMEKVSAEIMRHLDALRTE